MKITIEPRYGEYRWALFVDGPLPDSSAAASAFEQAVELIGRQRGGRSQLWIRGVGADDDAVVAPFGFEPYRDLWQLQVPLPAEPSELAVRPFDPATDRSDLIAVNNRAFAWHPEQGDFDDAELDHRMSQPWFDPEGLLVHEIDGRMAGFCWTKIDPDDDPPLGEIYVICVDPPFHGRGIGGPLTRAGLDHLHAKGATVGMLYVESDNDAANRVYERIGFTHHRTDRAYAATIEAP